MGALSKFLSVVGMIIPVGIIALSACTATIESSPPRPQACTMERAPVCGQRGSQTRTFQNACIARSQGFRVAHSGQCRSTTIACTREFEPVCARRGNQSRTFDNSCLARRSGFSVVHRGECLRTTSGPAPVACPLVEAPVCAARGNRTRSFANECMARADGYRVIHDGNCRR